MAPLLPLLLLVLYSLHPAESGTVGVNWGRVANDLPSATNVVRLLLRSGITRVKLYDADPAVLRALSGTPIGVTVTLPNELLLQAASRPSFAHSWVLRNVAAYLPATRILAVAVGNEVFADPRNLTSTLVPAMTNVHSSLRRLRLDRSVKVSSPVALTALSSSYPPSSGAFRPDLAASTITPMLDLLRRSGSPLMVNVYPFFAYSANADVISLDYSLFRPNPGVADTATGLVYYSLLDAQLDAVLAATRALGYKDVKVVVSETGWPSKGDVNETGAGAENAAAYNGNLIRRVLSGNGGTPARPDANVDVYIFALFNENKKPGPTSERNYGLFYPSEEKVYDIDFQLGGSGSGSGSGGSGSSSASSDNAAGGSDGSGGGKEEGEERTTRKVVKPPANGGRRSGSGETWCVANGAVGEERLQAALDYACGEGGADCGEIQPGAACYHPNTLEAHASFAFNYYYQKRGRAVGTCDFEGAGFVVAHPTKYGKCELPTGV